MEVLVVSAPAMLFEGDQGNDTICSTHQSETSLSYKNQYIRLFRNINTAAYREKSPRIHRLGCDVTS